MGLFHKKGHGRILKMGVSLSQSSQGFPIPVKMHGRQAQKGLDNVQVQIGAALIGRKDFLGVLQLFPGPKIFPLIIKPEPQVH